MRRSRRALAVLVCGAIAARIAYEHRLHRRDRLNIYFDDGSFVTYVDGSTDAAQLFPLARQVLAAARDE